MPNQPPRFSRFRDLDQAALNVEYQVHTSQTDGQASIEDILRVAQERRLSAIAFTEHVRRDTEWFEDFAKRVRKNSSNYTDLRVFVGCETKALDTNGSLDVSEEILMSCDLVLGSVHSFPNGSGGYLDFKNLDANNVAEIECELALGLLKYAPIHVLAHPGGMYQYRFGQYPKHLFRKMLMASLARGIAIEINSSYLVNVQEFLSLCEEINPYVSIGSDVHRLDQVGHCRDLLRGTGMFKR